MLIKNNIMSKIKNILMSSKVFSQVYTPTHPLKTATNITHTTIHLTNTPNSNNSNLLIINLKNILPL